MGAAAKKHAMETFTNEAMVSKYRGLGMQVPPSHEIARDRISSIVFPSDSFLDELLRATDADDRRCHRR